MYAGASVTQAKIPKVISKTDIPIRIGNFDMHESF
jgi:hypothetical protein